jgi:Fe-S-cluster-containing dehydrogenase component
MEGGKTMKIMIVDIARCNGCHNCQIACKDEHVDNEWPTYTTPQPDTGHFWMRVVGVERGQCPKVKIAYIAQPCMHCEDPQCKKFAQESSIYKRDDGIVIIDPLKSKGQKQIVDACPYGATYWKEGLDIPQKCTFCAHLLDQGWKEPRCVQSCPTGALIFGEYDELKELIKEKNAEVLHPEFGTKPSVYYIGLPKRFVAGAVFSADMDDPIENANINLVGLSTKVDRQTKTDNYGDFEFEELETNVRYSVLIEKAGYQPVKIETVHTEKDVFLGEILLTPESNG